VITAALYKNPASNLYNSQIQSIRMQRVVLVKLRILSKVEKRVWALSN